jgi:hypothetical protein
MNGNHAEPAGMIPLNRRKCDDESCVVYDHGIGAGIKLALDARKRPMGAWRVCLRAVLVYRQSGSMRWQVSA